jgi:hypothetical protein
MSFGPTRQRRTSVIGGASFQIPIRLRRTSGLKRGPAATLNQNPIFAMASIIFI